MKKILLVLVVCLLWTSIEPVKAEMTGSQKAAVGMYGAAVGGSLIEKWVQKSRAKKSRKKIKKMQKNGDPKADCYYVRKDGHLDVYIQDCVLSNGQEYKDMLCTTCVKWQEELDRAEAAQQDTPASSNYDTNSYNTSESEYDAQQAAQKQEEERQQKLEAERLEAERLEAERREAERRAAEEKKQAIEKIASIIPNDYKFDVVELSDTQKQQLDEVAEVLNKYTDVSVLLIGHTCKIGYKSINMKKGLQRANVAKDYLISKGVAEQQIQVDSKGELQPIANNNTREGRAQNRRIEIMIVK